MSAYSTACKKAVTVSASVTAGSAQTICLRWVSLDATLTRRVLGAEMQTLSHLYAWIVFKTACFAVRLDCHFLMWQGLREWTGELGVAHQARKHAVIWTLSEIQTRWPAYQRVRFQRIALSQTSCSYPKLMINLHWSRTRTLRPPRRWTRTRPRRPLRRRPRKAWGSRMQKFTVRTSSWSLIQIWW